MLDTEVLRFTLGEELTMLARLAVAGVAGGVVGYERGRADHPAGVRTLALVAMGAAAFMLVSIVAFSDAGVTADPARIAAQVATGVGFIGAGVVVRSGRRGVRGLTTAAAIWMSAALGLAAGAGMYVLALGAALLTSVLLLLPHVERIEGLHPRSSDGGREGADAAGDARDGSGGAPGA